MNDKVCETGEAPETFKCNVHSLSITLGRGRAGVRPGPLSAKLGLHPGQVTSSSKRRDRQASTLTPTDTFCSQSAPAVHVFGLWEESGVPGEHLRSRHRGNMQTLERKTGGPPSEPRTFLERADKVELIFKKGVFVSGMIFASVRTLTSGCTSKMHTFPSAKSLSTESKLVP